MTAIKKVRFPKAGLPPLFCLFLSACSALTGPEISVAPIQEIYGGACSVVYGIRTSTSDGSERYMRVTVPENELIRQRFVQPEAMANRCAVALYEANPKLMEGRDLLEVAVGEDDKHPTPFALGALKWIAEDFGPIDTAIRAFIQNVEHRDWAQSVAYIEQRETKPAPGLEKALRELAAVLPPGKRDLAIVGYDYENKTEELWWVDAVLTQGDTHRLLKFRVVRGAKGMRIREFSY